MSSLLKFVKLFINIIKYMVATNILIGYYCQLMFYNWSYVCTSYSYIGAEARGPKLQICKDFEAL